MQYSIDDHLERYSFYTNYEQDITNSVKEFIPRHKVVLFFDLLDRIELGKSPEQVLKLINIAKPMLEEIYNATDNTSVKEVLDAIRGVFKTVA